MSEGDCWRELVQSGHLSLESNLFVYLHMCDPVIPAENSIMRILTEETTCHTDVPSLRKLTLEVRGAGSEENGISEG